MRAFGFRWQACRSAVSILRLRPPPPPPAPSQSTKVFQSYDSYQSFSEDSSSSSGFFLIGAYARQSVHGYMRQKIQEQQYIGAIAGQAQTTYKAAMRWGPVLLRHYLQTNYSDLPIVADQALLPAARTSAADRAAYQAFIDRYGTHYLSDADFGGHMHIVYTLNSSFVKSTNISFSEEMSSFGLTLGFVTLGFGHGGAHAKASITAQAKSMSELAFVGYGGSQPLLQSGLYSLWRHTIPASAAPINSTYTAISEVIADPARRALMEDAIAEYLNVTSSGPNEPNQPFGLPPVRCGASPGSANTSIDAVPVTPAAQRLAGDRRRHAAIVTDGHAAVLRGAPAAFGAPRRPLLAGKRLTIDTPAGPMRLVVSSRPPPDVAAITRSDPALAGAPALAAAQHDPLTGGLILPVPGPDLGVGFGYDAANGTLRAPVVEGTATLQNTTWFDPSTNITWRVPDHWTFASTPFSCAEEVSRAFTNSTFVAEFNAKMTMFGIGIGFDGLSIGAFFSSQREKASASLESFASGYYGIERSVGMFRLSAGHGASGHTLLRSGFVETVKALPTDVADPSYERAYNGLLTTFGTHYVHQAALGGSCSLGISYNQSMLLKYSEEYKKNQFGIMIGYMFDGIGINFDLGFSKAQFTETIDQAFKDASTFHVECVGGDPSKLEGLDYLGWLISVGFHPTLVPQSVRLRPLYELVSFDPVRRAHVQQAVQGYINKVGGK